jgi:hypothetical protein
MVLRDGIWCFISLSNLPEQVQRWLAITSKNIMPFQVGLQWLDIVFREP